MFRQALSFFGVSAVAVTALVWAADPALAQHGGGGHGGGGHGGGGGGGHGGGAVGHFSGGARFGGSPGAMHGVSHAGGRPAGAAAMVHPGLGNGRAFGNSAFRGAAVRGGNLNGFANRRGYYGGYPNGYGGGYGLPYGGGLYDNSYYFGAAIDMPAYSAAPAYSNSYYFGGSSDSYTYDAAPIGGAAFSVDSQAFTPPEQAPADPNAASLTVRVPADAEIWFDGTKMTQTGTVHHYVTPPLTPGQEYSYLVRVRWTVAGRVFDQTQKVSFRPGQSVLVDFLTPRPSTGEPPAGRKEIP